MMDLFTAKRSSNGSSLTEKEQKILARLNARKNRNSFPNEHVENNLVTNEQRSVIEEGSDSPGQQKTRKKKKILSEDKEEVVNYQEEDGNSHDNFQSIDTEAMEIDNPESGFTVLEEVKSQGKVKVHRVLPHWLAHPAIVSSDLKTNKLPIGELPGLDKFVIENLQKNNVEYFFPVQQLVIPWLLKSQNSLYRANDICVSAPTGSGKTLAFVLPIVQALSRRTICRVRALVVLPVHDLAVQVYKVFLAYCKGTNLHVALISGHVSFLEEQKSLVRKGKSGEYLSKVDIVVCTPGRLVDNIQRTPGFSLTSLRFLVIDEADRIMEETHNDWLLNVEKAAGIGVMPLIAHKLSQPWETRVQKLLFSATLSQDPEKLNRLGLFQPKLFTSASHAEEEPTNQTHHFVGKYTTPAELKEHFTVCSPTLKPIIVYHLLKKYNYAPALCFTSSRAATHRLCVLLDHLGDLKVAEFSAEISKADRNKLLKQFSKGAFDLLVCTDAVARGMDLGVVDCVISYDPPPYVKNYIHRIGRTARAGRPGTAITILTDEQVRDFKKLIETAEKKNVDRLEIVANELEDYEDQFRSALDALKLATDKERLNRLKKSFAVRRRSTTFRRKSRKNKIKQKGQ